MGNKSKNIKEMLCVTLKHVSLVKPQPLSCS